MKKKIIGIYKITSPIGNIYIGQSEVQKDFLMVRVCNAVYLDIEKLAEGLFGNILMKINIALKKVNKSKDVIL